MIGRYERVRLSYPSWDRANEDIIYVLIVGNAGFSEFKADSQSGVFLVQQRKKSKG